MDSLYDRTRTPECGGCGCVTHAYCSPAPSQPKQNAFFMTKPIVKEQRMTQKRICVLLGFIFCLMIVYTFIPFLLTYGATH